ncbi:hypothetical protein CYMTET_32236 [Cymbomonas tetramitiformis]|uniref:Uncharacterized protein n=1 Tax=Cymbomonas tetramitiformis TaxID=36881 RepID=A0AAE0FFP6_9CHLO|nr:hypothetical protein CYMTET_32236 [Cymbomonas tetramitiformis]
MESNITERLYELITSLSRDIGASSSKGGNDGVAAASVTMLSKMVSRYDMTKVSIQQTQRVMQEHAPDKEKFVAKYDAIKHAGVKEVDRYLMVVARIVGDADMREVLTRKTPQTAFEKPSPSLTPSYADTRSLPETTQSTAAKDDAGNKATGRRPPSTFTPAYPSLSGSGPAPETNASPTDSTRAEGQLFTDSRQTDRPTYSEAEDSPTSRSTRSTAPVESALRHPGSLAVQPLDMNGADFLRDNPLFSPLRPDGTSTSASSPHGRALGIKSPPARIEPSAYSSFDADPPSPLSRWSTDPAGGSGRRKLVEGISYPALPSWCRHRSYLTGQSLIQASALSPLASGLCPPGESLHRAVHGRRLQQLLH